LVDFCDLYNVDIPGWSDGDPGSGARQVGRLMKRVFQNGDTATVEGFTVTRRNRQYTKIAGGGVDFKPDYTFTK